MALANATVQIDRNMILAHLLRQGAKATNRRAENCGRSMERDIKRMINGELGPGKGPEDSAKRGMVSMRAITWTHEVNRTAAVNFPIFVTLSSPDLDGPTGAKFGALNYGDGPHGIDARLAPWLIFMGTNEWAGQIIKIKHVNHPGHTGKQWLARTLKRGVATFKAAGGGQFI